MFFVPHGGAVLAALDGAFATLEGGAAFARPDMASATPTSNARQIPCKPNFFNVSASP